MTSLSLHNNAFSSVPFGGRRDVDDAIHDHSFSGEESKHLHSHDMPKFSILRVMSDHTYTRKIDNSVYNNQDGDNSLSVR